MKFLNKKKKALKELEAVQDLIPIKAIDKGRIITKDNRVVQILKASSMNLLLMSWHEQKQVFRKFELMLKTMTFPSQIEVVAQPLNLHKYREDQTGILKNTVNPFRQKLLEAQIDYIKSKETSRSVMQRKRYIIFDSEIKTLDEKGYERACAKLQEKEVIVKRGLKSLGLSSSRLIEAEINQLFHILFDYETALHLPILNNIVPNHTIGGNKEWENYSTQSKETEKKLIVNL